MKSYGFWNSQNFCNNTVATSRLMVVSREAKEEAATGTLTDSRLTHEYFTGIRALKSKMS